MWRSRHCSWEHAFCNIKVAVLMEDAEVEGGGNDAVDKDKWSHISGMHVWFVVMTPSDTTRGMVWSL